MLCDYDDIVISAGFSDIYQLIAFFQIHGDQSRLPVSIEVGQGGLLDYAVLGDSHKESILGKFFDRNDCRDSFSLQKVEEIDYRSTLGRSGGLRYLIGFYPVSFSCIGKEHEIVVS